MIIITRDPDKEGNAHALLKIHRPRPFRRVRPASSLLYIGGRDG